MKLKVARHLIRLVLLVMCFLAPPHSFALITGVTVAPVSVRASPNGDVVDSLKVGTIVGIVKVTGEWVQVMYFPTLGAKNVKTGWVGLKYIRITSRSGSTGGDDCETEYKTGAEVCVTLTDAELHCQKDYSGEHYRDCEVTVKYELKTNYSGGAYLDVEVECKVEISYMGPGMYSWRSDSSSENESHSLHAHGSESDSFTFDFSFSSYNKVTRVKIDSASCEIESVNLW
jgi:hypothetical protein